MSEQTWPLCAFRRLDAASKSVNVKSPVGFQAKLATKEAVCFHFVGAVQSSFQEVLQLCTPEGLWWF